VKSGEKRTSTFEVRGVNFKFLSCVLCFG